MRTFGLCDFGTGALGRLPSKQYSLLALWPLSVPQPTDVRLAIRWREARLKRRLQRHCRMTD